VDIGLMALHFRITIIAIIVDNRMNGVRNGRDGQTPSRHCTE
jgi:hypothetical protein